nr:ferredoxin [Rhizobium sp. Q54]
MTGRGILDQISAGLEPAGILLRGIARFGEGEGPALDGGGTALSVVLLGNIGGSVWPAFSRWRRRYGGPDQLDTWSKAMIQPVARKLAATAWFPSDPPYQPFQQWAMRAEALAPSPLGILLHPRYGLWHGYRGALGFSFEIGGCLSVRDRDPSADGWEDACTAACPAGAVTKERFDVAACRAYLGSDAGQGTCMVEGCRARDACPVGAQFRYPPEQVRFHMQALF